MLQPRSGEILDAAVHEFIETGEPVSSSSLFEHYDFGIKPAMIRFELHDLTQHGYLEQPHHSAGRVPTNKGFDFYAQRVLDEDWSSHLHEHLTSLFEENAWGAMLQSMSRELGILGIALDETDGKMYKDGLDTLVDRCDWESREQLVHIIRDIENIEERLKNAPELIDAENEVEIFVGKKSPFTTSEQLSVTAGRYNIGDRSVVVVAVGPTRMNYKKAANIFNGFKTRAQGNVEE